MKILASLLFTLFCSYAFAGPGDGPIVPWPTSLREDILMEDIQGSWIGYIHNSIWFVDIHPAIGRDDSAVIRVASMALFTHKAEGLLNSQGGLFMGEIVMDENHRASLLIFKDGDGTTLRMAEKNNRFHDIKLYKTQPGRRHD